MKAPQKPMSAGSHETWLRKFGTHAFYALCLSVMPKTIEQWLLFKYVDGEFPPLSNPFKTFCAEALGISAVPSLPAASIAVGVIRTKQ
jgi:hypothetical protein